MKIQNCENRGTQTKTGTPCGVQRLSYIGKCLKNVFSGASINATVLDVTIHTSLAIIDSNTGIPYSVQSLT